MAGRDQRPAWRGLLDEWMRRGSRIPTPPTAERHAAAKMWGRLFDRLADAPGRVVTVLRSSADDAGALRLLAAEVRQMFGAGGCAIVQWRAARGESRQCGAVGIWDGVPLAEALARSPLHPANLPDDGDFRLVRFRGTLRVARKEDAGSASSAIGVTLRHGSEKLGILILADLPAADRATIAGLALIGECVSLWIASARLHRRSCEQAERIARLSNDVERISSLLRQTS